MYIHIGFILFSLFVGFIIGASNSPVIAPFITAMFGLIGSIIGVEFLISKSRENSISAKAIGFAMSFIAIGLFLGTVFGELYRSNTLFSEEKTLPWGALMAPESTNEALDWIVVKDKMNGLGYSDEQVEDIYKIRASETVELKNKIELEIQSGLQQYERTRLYDRNYPFHAVFPFSVEPKVTPRGVAIEVMR